MVKRLGWVVLGIVWSTGCATEPLTVDDMAPEEAYVQADAGPAAMRRLTQAQFYNSIRDLFGEEVVVPDLAEPDVVASGLPSIGASEASYSSRGVELTHDEPGEQPQVHSIVLAAVEAMAKLVASLD